MSLAILYGSGHLAEYIRQNIRCDIAGVDIRVDPAADNIAYGARKVIELDELESDKIRKLFESENVSEVILCGRPALNTLHFHDGVFDDLPDFNPSATYIFNLIEKKIFQPAGVTVVGANNYVENLTPGPGYLVSPSGTSPPIFAQEIYDALPDPKFFRATHAAIAEGTQLLAYETATGTDQMIRDYIVEKRNKHTAATQAIFYKFPLKKCNPYFDVPVIGPETIRLLTEASIQGIVVHHEYCFIDQKDETVNLCHSNGLFVFGVSVN